MHDAATLLATPRRRPRTPSPPACSAWTWALEARAVQSAQPSRTREHQPHATRASHHDPAPLLTTPTAHRRSAAQSDWATIFFGTPNAAERETANVHGASLYELPTPLRTPPNAPSDSDGSPGMARAASPSTEQATHRALLREALGDVSNVRSAPRSPSKGRSPPKGASPRTPQHAAHAPTSLTPVQSLLHDWASTKFPNDRRSPHVSPTHMPLPALPAETDVFSSPTQVPTPRTPADRSPHTHETTRSARLSPIRPATRVPAQRVPAQRMPSMATAPPAPFAYPHAEPVRSSTRRTPPAPELVSPERTTRLARPVRYASHVPATRVWDSPEKRQAKRACIAPTSTARATTQTSERPSARRLPDVASRVHGAAGSPPTSAPGPMETPQPEKASNSAPEPMQERTTSSVAPPNATALRRSTRPITRPLPRSDAPSVGNAPRTRDQPPPVPAPTSTQRAEAKEWRAFSPDASRAKQHAVRASRLRRPMPLPPPPPPPPLSATELARITTQHTKQNETYTVDLQTEELRVPGARPPSPSQAFHIDARPREPHWAQAYPPAAPGDPRTPPRHARGAGEADEYTSPPRGTRGVRWHKRLVVSPVRGSAPRRPARGCLAPAGRAQALDAFGNVVRTGATGARRRTVTVKRFLYDEEQ